MIQDVVTFMGAQGHRWADIAFFATCVVTPFYIVDFFDEGVTVMTKFFTEELEAEEAAKEFAFNGTLKDIK